ncbi:hypothetical protein LSAT2_029511 [Lamellibrachia satsuma]|nr:hypothetical protein LSAT2_029511 [Lamellibrachia satsuma]
MDYHSYLRCAVLTSSSYFMLPIHALMMPVHVTPGLPLPILPSTIPSDISRRIPALICRSSEDVRAKRLRIVTCWRCVSASRYHALAPTSCLTFRLTYKEFYQRRCPG